MADNEFQPSPELQHIKNVYEERTRLLATLQEDPDMVARQMADIDFADRIAAISEKLLENNAKRSERLEVQQANETLQFEERSTLAKAIEYQAQLAELEAKFSALEKKPLAVPAVVEHFRQKLEDLRNQPSVDDELRRGLDLLNSTETQPEGESEGDSEPTDQPELKDAQEIDSSRPEWWGEDQSAALRVFGNNITLIEMFLANPEFTYKSEESDEKLHGNKQTVQSAKYLFRKEFLPKFKLYTVESGTRPITFRIEAEDGFNKTEILQTISQHLEEFPPQRKRFDRVMEMPRDVMAGSEEPTLTDQVGTLEPTEEVEAVEIESPESDSMLEQAGITKERVAIAASFLDAQVTKLKVLYDTPKETQELNGILQTVVKGLKDQTSERSVSDLYAERRHALRVIINLINTEQSNDELMDKIKKAGWDDFFIFISECNDRAAKRLSVNGATVENPLISFLDSTKDGVTGHYDDKTLRTLSPAELRERLDAADRHDSPEKTSTLDRVLGAIGSLFKAESANAPKEGAQDEVEATAAESVPEVPEDEPAEPVDTNESDETTDEVPAWVYKPYVPQPNPESTQDEEPTGDEAKNTSESSAVNKTIDLLKSFANGKNPNDFFSLSAFYSSTAGGKVPLDEQTNPIQKLLPPEAKKESTRNIPLYTIPALGVMYFLIKNRDVSNTLFARKGRKKAVEDLYDQFKSALR